MHLVEPNIGRLIAPTDDPRVAEFMDCFDRIIDLAKRMLGCHGKNWIKGDPLCVANRSVLETCDCRRGHR